VASLQEIAQFMRKSYDTDMLTGMKGPTTFFADRIEVCYVPARPSDGWFDGQRLRDYQETEVGVIRQVLPDARLEDVGVYTRADDQIIVVMTVKGTLKNGDAFAAPITMVYDLKGGEIVRVTGMYEPSKLTALSEAFEKASTVSDIPIAMTKQRDPS
jgi:ketosteroid isomerase-like protein